MMNAGSADFKRGLHEALANAFPSHAALQMLATMQLGVNLARVAAPGSLDSAIKDLIEWAESRNGLGDLLASALRQNPDNPELRQMQATQGVPDVPDTFRLPSLLQRISGAGPPLVGRTAEQSWLDRCFESPETRVAVLHGFGGVGKTALVRHWLTKRFGSDQLHRFVSWSFFSQGTSDKAASTDQCCFETLRDLGDPDPNKGSLWIRGRRMADLIGQQPTIVFLDGIEPLQDGPSNADRVGRIRDPGLREFLDRTSKLRGDGLCVVSTRLRITEPYSQSGSWSQYSIDMLETDDAVALLRARGLRGTAAQFSDAVDYLGRHALAVVLAAEYLNTFHRGDIGKVRSIPLVGDETRAGRHARSVLGAYEAALRRDNADMDVGLLEVVGLFDRPARWTWIDAIRRKPFCASLTKLGNASDEEMRDAARRLEMWALLFSLKDDVVDAHPMVREYFGNRFKVTDKSCWTLANDRCYDHLIAAAGDGATTVSDLEPVLLAIIHGCRAGRYRDALRVYVDRVMRGDEYFATATLGLYGTMLTVLSQFFVDGDVRRPHVVSEAEPSGLNRAELSYVLSHIGQFASALRGYADPEVERAYTLALTASDNADSPARFRLVYGLWRHHSGKGDLGASRDEAEALLAMSASLAAAPTRAVALRCAATTAYRLGEFTRSKEYATACVALEADLEATGHRRVLGWTSDSPVVNCKCLLALCSWILGDWKGAREVTSSALREARQLNHPHAYAVALYLGSTIADFERDFDESEQLATEMINVSSEYGFSWWLAAGQLRWGWAVGMSKDAEVGLVALRDGMRLWHSTGASIGVPYWKALLSDVLVKCNDFEGATVALDEAVICMDSTNEKWFEPEIHRRRGELLLISAEDDVGAEAAFKQACKTARATGAVAFERQALMSLRDLLTKAERSDDAQHVEAALQSLDVSGPSTSGGRP